MLGDFLFTCWMDAGSPDLSDFIGKQDKFVGSCDESANIEEDEKDEDNCKEIEGEERYCEMK